MAIKKFKRVSVKQSSATPQGITDIQEQQARGSQRQRQKVEVLEFRSPNYIEREQGWMMGKNKVDINLGNLKINSDDPSFIMGDGTNDILFIGDDGT